MYKKIGLVGKVIPNGKLRIKHGENEWEGEIVYIGNNVCMGYACNSKDLGKCDENNGILYTGDIGYLDEKEMLIREGGRFIK